MVKVIIPGRFPGLNEFIAANRTKSGKYNMGNHMKQDAQRTIMQYLPRVKFKRRIFIEYNFFEPNSRRDKDNISGFFHKVFQDALVQAGCIENDGWRTIKGMADYFEVDKRSPRIEVIIQEVK